ncbi:hypothetical protein ACA910_009226 [Epithemia clementina (nom. ined.)]
MSRSVSFAPEFAAADEDYYDEDDYAHYDPHHDASQQQQPPSSSTTTLAGDTTPRLDQKFPARQSQHHGQSSLFCPNCGGREIEQQDASGASVCMDCGVVVEENAIVSAVEFAEGAGGSTSMIGQFVSATSSKAFTGGGGSLRGGRFGFSRDSRETTLANGRRRILEVASRLRLGGHYIDAAHRLFTIAVEKNFIQGRRTTHVVAACLYIVCRQEKSQHMLIDFSDALQVNVYTLGTCFLKFRRLLGLKLELLDPALYVYRFAAHLDLDERANAVSLTALRLVARMKRDWIVAGRRPAGICAAALLIAARAHGFSKHHQDVTRILRVCGMTVTNRVREFELTPAAKLTLDQFHKVDLESEADPPAYSRNKIREARVRAIQDGNTTLLTSGVLDNPLDGERKSKSYRLPNQKVSERQSQFRELYSALEHELMSGERRNRDSAESASATNAPLALEAPANDTNGGEAQQAAPTKGVAKSKNTKSPEQQPPQQQMVVGKDAIEALPKALQGAHPKDQRGNLMLLADQATEEERLDPVAPVETKFNLSEWKESMPESMENELDDIFRSDEEEQQKEAIFNKINKDYLLQQQRKDEAGDGNGEGKSRAGRPRKRKGDANGGGDETGEGTSTEEQLRAAMASRKVSRKINYDALSSIFDEDGSLGNVVSDERGASGGDGGGGDDALFDF